MCLNVLPMLPRQLHQVPFVVVSRLGECLGGALWWEDLYKIAEDVGFLPPRLVTASRITISNKELESVVGKKKKSSLWYATLNLVFSKASSP